MEQIESRVTIHMVAILGGFIARTDGSVDWLDNNDTLEGGKSMDPELVKEFLRTIGCYVMGSRTYETALGLRPRALGGLTVTRQPLSSPAAVFRAAIDPPHRIKQQNQKSPERNKFEAALGELIVSGGGLMAARANCRRPLARTNIDLNTLVIGSEAGLLVNKSGKTVTSV